MVTSAYKPSKRELDYKFKKAKHVEPTFQLLQPLPKHKNKWQHCIKTLFKQELKKN